MSDLSATGTRSLILVVAGFLPNEVWRMVGLWFGGGVDEGSEVLVWVRAVATAILAGVIAQILVLPRCACERAGLSALRCRSAGFRFPPGAIDLCRRDRRRNRPGRREMVARLIAAARNPLLSPNIQETTGNGDEVAC